MSPSEVRNKDGMISDKQCWGNKLENDYMHKGYFAANEY